MACTYRRIMSYHSPIGDKPKRVATVYRDRGIKAYVVFFYEDDSVGKRADYIAKSLEDAVFTASNWVNHK